MATVWKGTVIKRGYVMNNPGFKSLEINSWDRKVVFYRRKTRFYEPSFQVTFSTGNHSVEDGLFRSEETKYFNFTDENKAMKKFMDLAFNGIAE